MKPVVTIYVEPEIMDFCNALLQREDRDPETEEIPYTFTADFGNGIEADIKVVNADPPYIDAVLFEDGSELFCLEPCFDKLEGVYYFPDQVNEEEVDYSVFIFRR